MNGREYFSVGNSPGITIDVQQIQGLKIQIIFYQNIVNLAPAGLHDYRSK